MSGIVCAVRGGRASQPTIARAIALAQESGLRLYFLYVVNLDFLSQTETSRVHTISEEMREMGEFIVLMAQETSARQGIRAEGVVRHGIVGDELIGLCRELQADYLVLGKPRARREGAVFSMQELSAFTQRTERETGATVIFSEGDMR
jgi:nucleotide-binding universal stress UspA family protein